MNRGRYEAAWLLGLLACLSGCSDDDSGTGATATSASSSSGGLGRDEAFVAATMRLFDGQVIDLDVSPTYEVGLGIVTTCIGRNGQFQGYSIAYEDFPSVGVVEADKDVDPNPAITLSVVAPRDDGMFRLVFPRRYRVHVLVADVATRVLEGTVDPVTLPAGNPLDTVASLEDASFRCEFPPE